jgi:stage II sporulation protein M
MMNYHNVIFTEIVREKINYSGLFIYILGENFREFIVFWLLSITILGIPYIVLKLITFGFSAGFFISAIAMQYGFKGIILILTYVFPHGIIYLPIIILCLHKGYGLCRSIYYENRNYMGTILKFIKSYLLLWMFLSVLLVLGSFLEAYLGSFFLKKTLGLFT